MSEQDIGTEGEEIEVVRRIEFKRNDRVITPDGPGKVDGYGSSVAGETVGGHSITNYDRIWVWLDGVELAPRLRPYDVNTVVYENA